MKLKTFIKSLEAIAMIGLLALGWFLGGVDLIWFVLISGGYVALNLTGYATKSIGDLKK
tara:strand:+ start:332 stop:508 length:177 start_codon:yes stop_codon:yes gene_type:complete